MCCPSENRGGCGSSWPSACNARTSSLSSEEVNEKPKIRPTPNQTPFETAMCLTQTVNIMDCVLKNKTWLGVLSNIKEEEQRTCVSKLPRWLRPCCECFYRSRHPLVGMEDFNALLQDAEQRWGITVVILALQQLEERLPYLFMQDISVVRSVLHDACNDQMFNISNLEMELVVQSPCVYEEGKNTSLLDPRWRDCAAICYQIVRIGRCLLEGIDNGEQETAV